MVAPSPYRKVIIDLHTKGLPTKTIVKQLGISRRTVQAAVRRFKTLGSYKDRVGRGRKRSATSPRFVNIIRKRIKRNPRRSMRKLAQQLGISKDSVGRIVKKKLKMYPYKRQKSHGLTAPMMEKRRRLSASLIKRFSDGRHSQIVFSDEKIFTIEAVLNNQNDRILAKSIQEANLKGRIVKRNAHPASVMVWGGITSNGKTPLVFIDSGVKMTGNIYLEKILNAVVKPWSLSHFGNNPWCFQQDSAPPHKAKMVQRWCSAEFPDFIAHDKWPPNSPDLSPLDFSVWSVLETKACASPHKSLDSLKAALQEAWDDLDGEYLRSTCDAFMKRLKLCVKAKGALFEL
jgi:inhibitor of nuclear factor kappa-B kinase subunit alpha